MGARLAARWFMRPPPRRTPRRREYAALLEAERFSFAFDGEQLAVYRWGEGPAVLLLHGWGGSASQLYGFVPALLQAGFSAIAFDAPAHGASTGSWLTLTRYAAAIARVAEHFGELHAIVAHSFGAPAVSYAIARGLRAERAVFIGPPADALAWFTSFGHALGLSAPVAAAAREAVELRAGVSLAQLNAAAFGPRLALPLLVVHDRLDREVPWSDGAAVAAASPQATLATTEGLGHRRILRDPGVVNRVLEFVRERSLPELARVFALPVGQAAQLPEAG
jgi:pimeloyl-ACP methyl ester carboxylesterase